MFPMVKYTDPTDDHARKPKHTDGYAKDGTSLTLAEDKMPQSGQNPGRQRRARMPAGGFRR